ncbi:PREDICTED: uncharacterized protein LOC109243298 isoform X1 [Nicotiana attenuata]|uniref:uncharacterized protein LOC109243298 isoform X1 n=1 Tax=Nicotiana attenuata TaxID=49451 RepID=UPI000905A2D1|nr:PREDICTED: uncharacterized protein LOC109243298 isoform X1 [Nicotiana attenuata]
MEDEENKGAGTTMPLSQFDNKLSQEAKLKHFLRNLTSTDLQLCSDASKEFLKLLKSDSGPEFLSLYIQNSSKCIELEQAWELRKGKTGLYYLFNLISGILNHSYGKNRVEEDPKVALVVNALDKFAKSIVEKRMNDLYKELNSKEAKRQRAALFLLASIVRRSSWMAWEVAKCFDFKIPVFGKLAEWKVKKIEANKKKHHSTRKAFVGFAISFLEVGNARLLRGVLQQKDMYSGVLRGLGNDDEDTVVYVLSTLRDKVLVPDSLVPTGLRSVLFGSVTLEQLASISGREGGGLAAELAHELLYMVCTDPSNGLMPDLKRVPSPLRGNPKRLLGLMKKLKAAEVENHRNLLLAIVKGKSSFGSAYLDEFPYNLEDPSSRNWFHSVSLAANVLSSVGDGLVFGFIGSQTQELPTLNSPEVQNIMKCIGPRSFSRLVINKGLLHSDPLAKHGTLKLVLEVLKLLELLIGALNSVSSSQGQMIHKWESLKQDIWNAVRIFLPDPQVLFSLLSSLNEFYRGLEQCSKRPADAEIGDKMNSRKKLKIDVANEDTDILVGGVSYSPDAALPLDGEGIINEDDMDNSKDEAYFLKLITELWGLHSSALPDSTVKETEVLFYSKLLNALTVYYKTMPTMLEGLFDFFKILPNNPLALPTMLQQALLSLLQEHVGWSSKCEIASRVHPQMYKHLLPFLELSMYSQNRDIKDQAYSLAKASMYSTGAFDQNPKEICSWFFFIPGYRKDDMLGVGCDIYKKLSSPVLLFLRDAVIETGNKLFYYLNLLRSSLSSIPGAKDASPDFSALTICILDKCLTLVTAESGAFSASEKSMVSLYMCNTLKYLLETQVDPLLLSSIIVLKLSERLEAAYDLDDSQCLYEWRPFKSLLHLSRRILQKTYRISSNCNEVVYTDSSFTRTVGEVQRLLKSESDGSLLGVTIGFCFSLACTRPAEIIQNFSLIMSVSNKLLGVPLSLLMQLFFSEPSLLNDASKRWREIFFMGLDRAVTGLSGGRTMDCSVISSMDSKSNAFSVFLDRAPFYILFPAILDIDGLDLSNQSGLQNLLMAKLSEETSDHLLSIFRYLLFWLNQAQLSYRNEHFEGFEKLSEACFLLLSRMLKELVVDKFNSCSLDTSTPLTIHFVKELVVTILDHPAVAAVLECPSPVKSDFACGIIKDSVDQFVESAKLEVSKMDHHVHNLLKASSELWLSFCHGQGSSSEVYHANKHVISSFKNVVNKLVMTFKQKMNECMKSKNVIPLVPTLCALHNLIHFISPFEMLELVHWMLSAIDHEDRSVWLTSVLCVGLHIAGSAFSHLAANMQQTHEKMPFCLFWGIQPEQFDVILYEKIFSQVYQIATRFELDVADICLLKAVKVVKTHKAIQKPSHPFLKITCRAVANTHVNILSHCMLKITKRKAEILFLVADISPLHLSVFGKLFSDMMNKYVAVKSCAVQKICGFSDEDMLMLLPTVILYLNSIPSKFGGQLCMLHENIVSFYWGILKQGFSIWKSYVSREIFQVECCENLSMEDSLNLISGSLLTNTVLVVQLFFELRGDLVDVKKRLSIFNSVCSSEYSDLLGFDLTQDGAYSVEESLNVVNRTVAKIRLCRALLFSEKRKFPSVLKRDTELIPSEDCSILDLARIRLLNLLVQSWQLIVKRCSVNVVDFSQIEIGSCSLFRYLEVYILRNLMEITMEMHDCLLNLASLPFIEQLAKSSLLHRFYDPMTLRMLRAIISSVSEGKFSCISIIQLLLAHSQFAATIHSSHISAGHSHFGLIFTPLPSIMRSYVPCTDQDALDLKDYFKLSEERARQLELVKLLKLLFQIRAQQTDIDNVKDIGINLRELVFLLLSSYGASMSAIDLEIYSLMDEIKLTNDLDEVSMAKLDFLWGSALLKVRKENELVQTISRNLSEAEAVDDYRRIHFRENIPIDPKVCATTVLYFPYDRTVGAGILRKPETDNPDFRYAVHYTDVEKICVYDPIFILRFSVHCLSMGFIEPLEFASLGLLAISAVSISSPDDDMRKLGYEVLGRFKSALEKCQKRKDVMRLRLLMSYLQNGIEEPWQKISSITAVFVAEASFVLLDPSHDHYSAISAYLMRSPSANMKGIPLFQNFFWSSSTNFIAERLWILRLLYSGLNANDDAHIYIRNAIFETLLSFYVSPISSHESKELIVQIVKKSVGIPKMARYLVEQCGLISWSSCVVSSLSWSSCRSDSFVELTVILEALNGVILSRHTIEWMQKYALEQLVELSCNLYKMLVERVEMFKGKTQLVKLILQIVTSAFKISQKRKVYQPHFTISIESLLQLCEAVDECCDGRQSPVAQIGLEAVLMSTPPVNILQMDKEKVFKFVRWATLIALQPKIENIHGPENFACIVRLQAEEETDDSLISKLVRWLAASVIVGKLSLRFSNSDLCHSFDRSKLNNLLSLMEWNEQRCEETNRAFACEGTLASSIFFLQQLQCTNYIVLPSVVSALCLLLLSSLSSAETGILAGDAVQLATLCSKINCPAEANPAWRWSFYQPWKDHSSELTDAEKLEENQACEMLLVVISKLLGRNSLYSQFFSFQDLEKLCVFDWERTLPEVHLHGSPSPHEVQ